MLYVNYISNLERNKKKHFELQKQNRSNYGTVIKELLNYTYFFQKDK